MAWITKGNARRRILLVTSTVIITCGYVLLFQSSIPPYLVNISMVKIIEPTPLSSANLSSADVSSADVPSANLSSADVSSADVPSANVSSAGVQSADVSSVNVPSKNSSSKNSSISSAGRFSCMSYDGRLGNLMFQYASVYGLSNQRGRDKQQNAAIILQQNDVIRENFQVPSSVVGNLTLCNTFVTLHEMKSCTFDPRLTHLANGVNYRFRQYLQSWKYFIHVADNVRRELTFRPSVKDKAVTIVEDARRTNSNGPITTTVVGIHIRRGDMLEVYFTTQGFNAASDEYIHHAVDYFLGKFQRVVFVVCCTDMDYSKRILNYRNITATFPSFSPAQDLAILSSCDHVIMTVGSFGWWSGFLSGGTVVYYKHPFKKGSHVWKQFTHEDYYMPEWVGLE